MAEPTDTEKALKYFTCSPDQNIYNNLFNIGVLLKSLLDGGITVGAVAIAQPDQDAFVAALVESVEYIPPDPIKSITYLLQSGQFTMGAVVIDCDILGPVSFSWDAQGANIVSAPHITPAVDAIGFVTWTSLD